MDTLVNVYDAELVEDPPSSEKPPRTPLLDRPWVILSILFFVTLFLGFPALWKSNGFSKQGKIVWTILVSLWTVLVFYVFFVVMAWSYGEIRGALEGM